jgi:UDP-N-acetylmuramoyl-tripeptide--D-alanyl-D-alanine ligase
VRPRWATGPSNPARRGCSGAGDALLICGKGHESGQIVGSDIFPFDDVEQASVSAAVLEDGHEPLDERGRPPGRPANLDTRLGGEGACPSTRGRSSPATFRGAEGRARRARFCCAGPAKGRAAALVTHRPEGVAEDAPLLVVPDVQRALEDLGRAGRARARARVVGITGSVGKTSTKEMMRAALGTQGAVHAAEASYNNHWGVPLTLARLPADADFAVLEIGMNHRGEIAPLSRQARPHVALITTIGAAHLERWARSRPSPRRRATSARGSSPGASRCCPATWRSFPS